MTDSAVGNFSGGAPAAAPKKKIALALQGGGSHGAFTWGVLDALVRDGRFEIEGISGTSAGAINGALLAYSLMKADADGSAARELATQNLRAFWRSISQTGDRVFNPYQQFHGSLALHGFVSFWAQVLSFFYSPYDNPFYSNTLKDLVERAMPDFTEVMQRHSKPALFICATNVNTNRKAIFTNYKELDYGLELVLDSLLASACLPMLFQAIAIPPFVRKGPKSSYYWDGGYTGNPALSPLLNVCQDILVVRVNAFERDELPMRGIDIHNRQTEITFNSAVVQEIELIETITKLVKQHPTLRARYRPINIHNITGGPELAAYGVSTKNHTSWPFLLELFELGQKKAAEWLQDPEMVGKVGHESSCNVISAFIERIKPRHKAPQRVPVPEPAEALDEMKN